VVGLYFSAHWCPPCRGFTPQLAATYTRFKAQHPRAADWEVVFVSSDSDAEAFAEYHGEMPWPALPYDSREAKAALSKMFKVGLECGVVRRGCSVHLAGGMCPGPVTAAASCVPLRLAVYLPIR
jgi:thiol-disulfide isomerase/thioredoxin